MCHSSKIVSTSFSLTEGERPWHCGRSLGRAASPLDASLHRTGENCINAKVAKEREGRPLVRPLSPLRASFFREGRTTLTQRTQRHIRGSQRNSNRLEGGAGEGASLGASHSTRQAVPPSQLLFAVIVCSPLRPRRSNLCVPCVKAGLHLPRDHASRETEASPSGSSSRSFVTFATFASRLVFTFSLTEASAARLRLLPTITRMSHRSAPAQPRDQ